MNAMGGVLSLLQDNIWCDMFLTKMCDEYVAGCYGMGEVAANLSPVVAKIHCDIDSIFGHGNEIYVFKRFLKVLSLWFFLPFLKEGREGIAVDDALGFMITHRDLSVTLHGNFSESLTLAKPSWFHIHLL